MIKTNCFKTAIPKTKMRTLALLYKCRNEIIWNAVGRVDGECELIWSLGFHLTLVHERSEHRTTAEQHSHHEHTGCLAENVSSLSLSKSGAIWRINVPQCRREVQIIAELETPPLLFFCRSKHVTTWTRSTGVALRPVNCKQSRRQSLQSVVVNVNKAIDVFVVKGNS